jgi:hypothetical protein
LTRTSAYDVGWGVYRRIDGRIRGCICEGVRPDFERGVLLSIGVGARVCHAVDRGITRSLDRYIFHRIGRSVAGRLARFDYVRDARVACGILRRVACCVWQSRVALGPSFVGVTRRDVFAARFGNRSVILLGVVPSVHLLENAEVVRARTEDNGPYAEAPGNAPALHNAPRMPR